MSASWPTSVATDSTLYVAVNELQNNLSAGINAAVTTIGLNSTTGFPTVGLVLIDNEVIKYGGISGNNLTSCTRAFDGTTAASHSSGAVVSFAFCAAHHNNLKDEIIAVETSLNFTASRALSTDTNGRAAVATTTLAELNFISGVTSAVQTQLNAKAPSASPTFTGTITTPLTASRALQTGASSELAVSATTATELGYLSGVTSAIQTQLTGKASTDLSNVASVSANVPMNSKKFTGLAAGSANGDSVRYEQIFNAAGYIIGTVVASASATSATTGTPTGGATYTTTNLTVSITPKATTHKIRVTVCGTVQNINPAAKDIQVSIFRGSTDLFPGSGLNQGFAAIGNGGVNVQICVPASGGVLDSPATTSATTYSVKIRNNGGFTDGGWGNEGLQYILVEEIAF